MQQSARCLIQTLDFFVPIIHFVFGSQFREGNLEGQATSFIEQILEKRALKSFCCREYLPRISIPGGKTAVPGSAVEAGDGGVTFTEWISSPPVFLLPHQVWMISFVYIQFKKLIAWPHFEHYGQLSIAFTNQFRKRAPAKSVDYYRLSNLALDPKVRSLERAFCTENKQAQTALIDEIVSFRKPATLWKELETQFTQLRLTKGPEGITIEQDTYSRYEVGYDFQSEKEVRIVTDAENRIVEFRESDVLSIIVPNTDIQARIEQFIEKNWSTKPSVFIYPGCKK